MTQTACRPRPAQPTASDTPAPPPAVATTSTGPVDPASTLFERELPEPSTSAQVTAPGRTVGMATTEAVDPAALHELDPGASVRSPRPWVDLLADDAPPPPLVRVLEHYDARDGSIQVALYVHGKRQAVLRPAEAERLRAGLDEVLSEIHDYNQRRTAR